MDIINAPIYKCNHCGLKDLYPTDFYRDKSRPNGLSGWCKHCRLAARHNSDKRRTTSYLISSFKKGRRNFSPKDRKKFDRLERYHIQCYFVVDGTVYRWGRWRKPAYESEADFILHQTELGRTVEVQ